MIIFEFIPAIPAPDSPLTVIAPVFCPASILELLTFIPIPLSTVRFPVLDSSFPSPAIFSPTEPSPERFILPVFVMLAKFTADIPVVFFPDDVISALFVNDDLVSVT